MLLNQIKALLQLVPQGASLAHHLSNYHRLAVVLCIATRIVLLLPPKGCYDDLL
uniref:Uncharacterized protein n=1 Tax=Arundo donax TaxID=35708 RepID=A0A0A9DPE5_ARUDO